MKIKNPKNINPLFTIDDKKESCIFFKGMYSINKLDTLMSMILSGRITPSEYRSRYAPRIFNYKKYIYDLLSMIDRTRNMDLVYIQLDAKQTLKEFDEIVTKFISTENSRDKFLNNRFF